MIRVAILILAAALAGAVVLGMMPLLGVERPLADLAVAEALERDVQNPSTAVLLLFRAHDTWLELVVVMVALLGLLAVEGVGDLSGARLGVPGETVLRAFATLLLPWAVLLAGYVVWLGTKEPGGAFQGGVIAATALVLLYFADRRVFGFLPGRRFRLLAVATVALPALLTLPGLVRGEPLLTYPDVGLVAWMLALEAAFAVGLAVELAALVVSGAAGAGAATEPLGDSERGS